LLEAERIREGLYPIIRRRGDGLHNGSGGLFVSSDESCGSLVESRVTGLVEETGLASPDQPRRTQCCESVAHKGGAASQFADELALTPFLAAAVPQKREELERPYRADRASDQRQNVVFDRLLQVLGLPGRRKCGFPTKPPGYTELYSPTVLI
jgi:hypothetical protein